MTQVNHFLSSVNVSIARKALKNQGFYLINEAYSSEFCQHTINLIDQISESPSNSEKVSKIEKNYGGSETRIWDAQKEADLLNRFYQESNLTISRIINNDVEAYTLLAIRNRKLIDNDINLQKDRWHIDSYSKQLKIFLFLTETSEASGPFEFIPNTHKSSFKLKMLMKGHYIRPSNLFNHKRAYQKITDEKIKRLCQTGLESTPVICKAGTVLIIDTSAIHRARPCINGARYALTAYYK